MCVVYSTKRVFIVYYKCIFFMVNNKLQIMFRFNSSYIFYNFAKKPFEFFPFSNFG